MSLLLQQADELCAYFVLRFGRRLGGRDGIEAVLRLAATKAVQAGATFDPARGELRGWLFRICERKAIEEARARVDPARSCPRSGSRI